ncbi:uncharacterized protein LOC111638312 [Centruroides sculpturatus]|uniref:uncharacterized protein LOC111638312 n=1 Tax=Centruroides sculpturatus TaxID=218467 RepID=UPI000C6EC210|nr:uncharacterized protein LOC111638312 [Centruroides sculpturatus]
MGLVDGMKLSQIIIKLCFVLILPTSNGFVKRCYTCRSRGEKGDCKDPFPHNATTVENIRGVEASPCASGWCAKVIEGQVQDFDAATERMCIQRPPVDSEERCAETFYKKRRVFMCFCQGDLCNGSTKQLTNCFLSVLSLILYSFTISRIGL